MGFFTWLKAAFSPSRLNDAPVLNGKPLWQQFQRIGGGIGPNEVTAIMRAADIGQPQLLVDLFNEARQKDGHLQSVCGTRDGAVALCDLAFVDPEKGSKLRDRKAVDLCRRIVDEFDNWPALIEHLTASYLQGHATSVIDWRKT